MHTVQAEKTRLLGVIASLALVFLALAATAPKETRVETPYGPLTLTAMRLVQVELDRPCGFAANLENTTGIRWTNIVFSVGVTGLDDHGNRVSPRVTVKLEYLDGDVVTMASGWCDRIWPRIDVTGISVSMVAGTPNNDDVTVFRRNQAARKRSAEQAAARSAYVSKLAVLTNGNDSVFVGSDQKCSEQFVQALSMDGLEKRKRMADLLAYGCGFLVKDRTHIEIVEKGLKYVLIRPAEGPAIGKSGWVPATWIK
jgi:hypothetical protein